MHKFIFCFVLMVMCTITPGFTAEVSEALNEQKPTGTSQLLEQGWICPNKIEPTAKITTIQSAIQNIYPNHILTVVDPQHYVFTEHSWDPLLTRARQFDLVVDENHESKADANGYKQSRDGFIIFCNTTRTKDFIRTWLQQTQEGLSAQQDHPTLFSYLISDFRKNQKLSVTNLDELWSTFPLKWSQEPLTTPLIASDLYRLKTPALAGGFINPLPYQGGRKVILASLTSTSAPSEDDGVVVSADSLTSSSSSTSSTAPASTCSESLEFGDTDVVAATDSLMPPSSSTASTPVSPSSEGGSAASSTSQRTCVVS